MDIFIHLQASSDKFRFFAGAQNELKLQEAALKNDVEQTRKILETKVDINAKGHVSTLFIYTH